MTQKETDAPPFGAPVPDSSSRHQGYTAPTPPASVANAEAMHVWATSCARETPVPVWDPGPLAWQRMPRSGRCSAYEFATHDSGLVFLRLLLGEDSLVGAEIRASELASMHSRRCRRIHHVVGIVHGAGCDLLGRGYCSCAALVALRTEPHEPPDHAQTVLPLGEDSPRRGQNGTMVPICEGGANAVLKGDPLAEVFK